MAAKRVLSGSPLSLRAQFVVRALRQTGAGLAEFFATGGLPPTWRRKCVAGFVPSGAFRVGVTGLSPWHVSARQEPSIASCGFAQVWMVLYGMVHYGKHDSAADAVSAPLCMYAAGMVARH